MTYAEKLKDPRWQKKRLEIFKRDDFTCQHCLLKSKPLHVHHKTYVYDKDPWDYDNNNFITLCVDCHSKEEIAKEQVQDLLHDLLVMNVTNNQILSALKKLLPNG